MDAPSEPSTEPSNKPDRDQKEATPATGPRVIKPGDPYVIPPEGSLGLLALGAVGLKLWREVREEAQGSKQETIDPNAEDGEQE